MSKEDIILMVIDSMVVRRIFGVSGR